MNRLLRRERELWTRGLERVAGVDEAGMGPLAGPIVAAAVYFTPGAGIPG
jgi:ribonuclease HII